MHKLITCVACTAVALVSMPAAPSCMDTDNAFWRTDYPDLYTKLVPHLSCPGDADQGETEINDQIACNYFVAKVLSLSYGVNDFNRPGPGTAWPLANDIVAKMEAGNGWHKIGIATEQANLDAAAKRATDGHAVVAGMKGQPNGHVAVVLPGKTQPTTTWKTADGKPLNVPNSASFFLNTVKSAYVFCRLSASFKGTDAGRVTLFYRDKP